MVVYPNAKINIGLSVIEKRCDGFHNLESIFYPIGLCDILEVVQDENIDKPIGAYVFTNSGLVVDCNEENNLVIKAYLLLAEKYSLPAIKVHLHKIIPMEAGLGGGSADAAFMLLALNEMFELKLSRNELEDYAACLGSDCPFFIHNKPMFVEGRGDILSEIELNIDTMTMVVVKPNIAISTPDAFRGIIPHNVNFKLKNLSSLVVNEWKKFVINDFEKGIFKLYPRIAQIKQQLYDAGASYVSMSGSGSSVFALFDDDKHGHVDLGNDVFIWNSKSNNIHGQ